MITKTTLRKALKFLKNCKSIFSFKKKIFQKNIFPVLFCLIKIISSQQARVLNLNLKIKRSRNNISSPDVYSNSNTPNIVFIRPYTDFSKNCVIGLNLAYEYKMNHPFKSKNHINT